MNWKEFLSKSWYRVWILLRWGLLAGVSGCGIGLIAGLFGRAITEATGFRNTHPWMLYLLPAAGLLIVAIYKLDNYKTSTNLVLESIQGGKYVPLRMAPLIIVSTILTHAGGGSAGREGAALQLGGSLGGSLGKVLKLSDNDRKIMIMLGMSAAFSALFGTPLTATVFSMEVISVGIMQYAALVPCAIAALCAKQMAILVGAHGEHFELPGGLTFDLKAALLVILLAFACALVSIIFCQILHTAEHLYKKYIPNEWIRIVAGACLVILITKLIGRTDYLGAGMNIVEEALAGKVIASAFLMKMIYTAITLGSGFKGGEIVPTLFVGATFGCLFGQIVGMNPAIAAACGLGAMFCGVTNCPISSLFLCFELFGFEYMPFFLIAVGISYMESGYFGLYHSQKIMYSKTQLKFIDRKTR